MKYVKTIIIAGLLAIPFAARAQVVPLEWFRDDEYYIVATGRMRTRSEALEYCETLGRRLPDRVEAEAVLTYTIDPFAGTTTLAAIPQVDVASQDGSFWTSEKQGLFGCPVALRVNPPEQRASCHFEKFCNRKVRFLTVCVKR